MGEETAGQAGWTVAGLRPGSVVAGFRVESRIGAGGMAVVLRARDESLGRAVALKVLAPGLARDAEFRERFVRESRAAARVDHPHIIPVYRADEAGGLLYLAMRYVSGGDLGAVVRRDGPLPAGRVILLLAPIASALDAAHAAGLVHRDVKPANILVEVVPGGPDHPYLSDFGLAKGSAASTGLTASGHFLGTLQYCAPEQIDGGRPVPQTDQYALAGTAYAALTGTLPFPYEELTALEWAHMSEPPPAVTALRPDLPAAADQVIARAMAKSPQDRYPTCGDFISALSAALAVPGYAGARGHFTQTRSQRFSAIAGDRTASRLSRRHVVIAALAVVVLAGAATATAVTLKRSGSGPPAASSTPAITSPLPGLVTEFQAGSQPGSSVALSDLAFHSTGNTLVEDEAGSSSVQAWSLANGHASPLLDAYGSLISANGELGLDATQEGGSLSWTLWSYPSGKAASRFSMSPPASTGVIFQSLSDTGTVALSTGTAENFHITGGDAASGVTGVWNARGGARIATLSDPDHAGLNDVEISPDGASVAAVDADAALYLWNVRTQAVVATLADPAGRTLSHNGDKYATFSADSEALAIQTSASSVNVWSIATRSATASSVPCSFLAISPDGKLLACAAGKGKINVVSAATGKAVDRLDDKDGKTAEIGAFSPDGTELALANSNNLVYLWKIPSA